MSFGRDSIIVRLRKSLLMFRFILLSLTLVAVSGCQKDVFDRLEDRLEGTWYFTNAEHRSLDSGSPFKSVFQFYNGDEITFHGDQTVVYNEDNGDWYQGVWELHAISGKDVDYILSFAVNDRNSGVVQYVWKTDGLWGDYCLRVRGTTSNYEFRYDLKKR